MKKPYLPRAALVGALFIIHVPVHSAIYDVSGTFINRDPAGNQAGTTDNNVSGIFNDTTGSLNLDTFQPHFGFLWVAEGQVYGEGNWIFETCLADGSSQCTAPTPLGMTVGVNQWGGHFLIDWGASQNMDSVNVWDVSTDLSGTIHLASTDPDGDGILGTPMEDGPFIGFSWSFDLTLTPQTVPVPPALWLFGSGLIGLVGMARRGKLRANTALITAP